MLIWKFKSYGLDERLENIMRKDVEEGLIGGVIIVGEDDAKR